MTYSGFVHSDLDVRPCCFQPPTQNCKLVSALITLVGTVLIVFCDMPGIEMLKRLTPVENLGVKKRTCSLPASWKQNCSENHAPNLRKQRSSHTPGSRTRAKKRGSHSKRKGLASSDDERTQESSNSCVTDDCSAENIKPQVSNGTPNGDSASSSSTASNHAAKLETLGSQYAELCISSDCSSKLSSGYGVLSSPRESSPDEFSELALPTELIHGILGHLEWRSVMQLRLQLGKEFRGLIHHPAFLRSRPSAEAEFSPSYFTTDANGDLHWHGLDTKSRKWASLPSLNFAKHTVLPSPDPDLFKDYLVAGDGGLLCINVGKSTGPEQLVVCNPLTHQVKVLPPLKYTRQPVLMHLRVVDDRGNYKILVAGSAAIGTEDVSLKTEEYDSRTGKWECPENSDLPCPPFGLNEYQNGVYVSDSGRELLLCVAIMDARGRGVLVYDLKEQKWVQGLRRFHIPLVRSEANIGYLATTQIVECGGSVFVFSEQECGREVYFLIHRLNVDGSEEQAWEEIMRRKRPGGRGLLVYPEFTCVAVSEHELGIFNSVEHTMEIIDLKNPTEVAPLLSAPSSKANRFHSLNPLGFTYRPSFKNAVCPRGRHRELRCKNDVHYCSECEARDSESGVQKNVGPKVRNLPVSVEPKGVFNETPRSTDADKFDGIKSQSFQVPSETLKAIEEKWKRAVSVGRGPPLRVSRDLRSVTSR